MHMLTADRMNRRRVCAAVIALALVLLSAFFGNLPAAAEGDGTVRVRLTRLGAPEAITMSADCDYCLEADASVRIEKGAKVTVSAGADGLALSWGKRKVALGGSAKLVRAAAGNRGMRFLKPELSGRFCGDLSFSASGGVVGAVLSIDVESYLYGVVGYEMPPSSPIEALKAQAVAARTYALRKKVLRANAAYDLTDTTSDQVFKGLSEALEYKNAMRAVDETRGGVLCYGDDLAQCYYCASNGGQTESARNAWGGALEYTRVQDDPYDLESGANVKSVAVNRDLSDMNADLRSALAAGIRAQLEAHGLSAAKEDVSVNAIESVTACDSRFAAPSRVYKSLTFKLNITGVDANGDRRTGTVAVSIPTFGGIEDWCDLGINSEDNETVWVSETDKAFIISFRRFGHGVGMSQRGAQVMAANYGMNFAEILAFYYPGTTGRVLELSGGAKAAKADAPQPVRDAIATARFSGKTDLLSEASDDALPTATVAAGAVVDVYAVQGEWAAVGSSGKYGFVRTDALQSFSLIGSTVERPERAAFGVAQRDAKVLQLPVDTSAAISAISAGDTVEVYAWTDAWVMLEAPDGLVGFAPLEAVELVVARKADEAQDQAGEAPDGGPIVRVKGNRYMYVSAETAYVYQSWSRDSSVIAALSAGDKVRIGAYNDVWACVRVSNGGTGYVLLSALSADAPARGRGSDVTIAPQDTYAVAARDGVPVYRESDEASEAIAALKQGERVEVGAWNREWAMVRLDGLKGYVRLQDLRKAS